MSEDSTYLREIAGSLGRIEQKIDGHMRHDAEMFAAQSVKNGDLYAKIESLDSFRNKTKGVAKGVSLASGVVASLAAAMAKAKGLW